MLSTAFLLLGCGSGHSYIETLPNERPGANSYATIVEDFDLVMPSGNRVFGMIRRPDRTVYANQSFAEADKFIGKFRGRYLRLQAEWDHPQPPSKPAEIPMFHQPPMWWQGKHTADMVNAAVAGGVPWVLVNLPEHGNQVNATYDADNQPLHLPGELADKPWGVRPVLEMARMD